MATFLSKFMKIVITPQTVLLCSSIFYHLAHHLYISPLSCILNTFPDIHYTLYADDIELRSVTTNATELQLCMDTIHNWLTSNHLQLKFKSLGYKINKDNYIIFLYSIDTILIHIYSNFYKYN